MRLLVVAVAVATLLPLAAADCAQNVDQNTALPCTSIPSCDEQRFARELTIYSNNSLWLNRYRMCTQSATGSCCVDVCAMTDAGNCISAGCALIPGRGTDSLCISKNKLCGLLSTTQCSLYPFCNKTDAAQPCRFQGPKQVSAPPGESVADKCPALHPLVVAMLALMFVTFIGAVGIVGFVVWKNQKKADEEEARREQAEAAAAEAKRARSNRRL